MRATLIGVAVALLALAAGIAVKQRRARSCSRHRHAAGQVAWVLAGLSVAGGVALLAWAVAWRG